MKTETPYNNPETPRHDWGWQGCFLRRLHWLWPIMACMMSIESYSAGPLQVLKRPGTQWYEKVHSLAFSPGGKILAVGSSAPSLRPASFPGDQRTKSM